MSDGEKLNSVYRALRCNHDKLLIPIREYQCSEEYINTLALSVRFVERGMGFVLRSIVEDWSMDQIIRELNS